MTVTYPQLAGQLGVTSDQVIPELAALQTQLTTPNASGDSLAQQLSVQTVNLTNSELQLFARGFERTFVLPYANRDNPLATFYSKHIGEALIGCMAAKFQMNRSFGGEVPDAGEFGMGPIRAPWLGVGNDWSDQPVLTAAALNNWIQSGTTLMGGTTGHAVKIGQFQVTVIIGYASNHPSPKVESLQVTLDGKPKPVIVTGLQVGRDVGATAWDMQVKEFQNALVLVQNRQILAQLWTSVGGYDIPVALGFSYISEDIMRLYVNPSGLPGSTNNVILTV